MSDFEGYLLVDKRKARLF